MFLMTSEDAVTSLQVGDELWVHVATNRHEFRREGHVLRWGDRHSSSPQGPRLMPPWQTPYELPRVQWEFLVTVLAAAQQMRVQTLCSDDGWYYWRFIEPLGSVQKTTFTS